ncbi:MAG: hypothetical protein V7637_471 [Mycobacteriales bacterium]
MRSVFAFPVRPQGEIQALLDQAGQRSEIVPGRVEWIIDNVLWIRVRADVEGLYADWDSDAIVALTTAVGSRPSYAVIADVSGRVAGHPEVACFLHVVIGSGGHAMDDYSEDVWTYEQITAGVRATDGRLSSIMTPASVARPQRATSGRRVRPPVLGRGWVSR